MEPAPAAVIAELQAEYDAAFRRVLDANRELSERLRRIQLSAYYDPEDDLAIVLFGPLAPCVMLEMDDHVWARLDPVTDAIIGLEFPHALAQLATAPEPVQTMIHALVEVTRGHPAEFVTPPPSAHEGLAADARELVPA